MLELWLSRILKETASCCLSPIINNNLPYSGMVWQGTASSVLAEWVLLHSVFPNGCTAEPCPCSLPRYWPALVLLSGMVLYLVYSHTHEYCCWYSWTEVFCSYSIPNGTLYMCVCVYQVLEADESSPAPKAGAYIRGLFLEGACWDPANNRLDEALPRRLHENMPPVQKLHTFL